MNKIKIVIGIIFVFLLIGIVSSGVISHFGKIKSTINILPPEIGVDVPATEEDCRNGGWENLMTLGVRFFDNENDCINYNQTYMCEDFKLLGGYPNDFDDYDSCIIYFGDGEIINGEGDEEEE